MVHKYVYPFKYTMVFNKVNVHRKWCMLPKYQRELSDFMQLMSPIHHKINLLHVKLIFPCTQSMYGKRFKSHIKFLNILTT